MRIASLVLCILGIAGAGFRTYQWWEYSSQPQSQALIEMTSKSRIDQLPAKDFLDREALLGIDLGWKILAGGVLGGIIGIYLVMNFHGLAAALFMIPGPIAAGYFSLDGLFFGLPLVLGGCFALFVWKKPKPKPPKRRPPKDEEIYEDVADVVVEEEQPARPKIPKTVSRFRCYSCSEVLRTKNAVQVGKKIRCPNCSQLTKILPLER